MQWQVRILLYSRITSLIDLDLCEVMIKCSEVKQMANFLCEILQQSQLFAPLSQKPGPWIIFPKHNLIYGNNFIVSA